MRVMRARLAVTATAALLGACATLKQAVDKPGIAQVAPEPVTPLAVPTQTMRGGRGSADASYPADFGVTVKSDGTIVFPQHTVGRVKGSNLLVGNDPVLTVGEAGEVRGVALKHRYKFEADGALLDEDGHGVRIASDGAVRGVGGDWHYDSVFAWAPEAGGPWDAKAWRTLELVALVLIENMLPQAIRDADARDAGLDAKAKGLTIRIPPPSEWFK